MGQIPNVRASRRMEDAIIGQTREASEEPCGKFSDWWGSLSLGFLSSGTTTVLILSGISRSLPLTEISHHPSG